MTGLEESAERILSDWIFEVGSYSAVGPQGVSQSRHKRSESR